MSILLDRGNRVLIQGITGHMGTFFVEDARRYGTQVVAGVSPGREGAEVGGVPVFGSVRAARETTGADTAIVFVPPAAVLGAALEAIEGGCRLVVATADELPVQDAIELRAAARHSSVPTRRASSRRARRNSASCPLSATAAARSASSPAAARSPTNAASA